MNDADAEKFAACYVRHLDHVSLPETWMRKAVEWSRVDPEQPYKHASKVQACLNHAGLLLGLGHDALEQARDEAMSEPADPESQFLSEATWSANLDQLREVWRRASRSGHLTDAVRIRIEGVAAELAEHRSGQAAA